MAGAFRPGSRNYCIQAGGSSSYMPHCYPGFSPCFRYISKTVPSPTAASNAVGGERTVKKLGLSKALTIPEGTTVSEACRRIADRRVDAVLLTDSNALLSGIITDKDISARVIAEGLRPEQAIVSKIMTRNPIFVTSDSLALEALQKMVHGLCYPAFECHGATYKLAINSININNYSI